MIALIEANYDVQDMDEQGKAACKASLAAGTWVAGRTEPSADRSWSVDWPIKKVGTWLPRSCSGGSAIEMSQWAILGAGEDVYHHLLHRMSHEHPHKVAARLEFSDRMAHKIEAGSDMFVMASRYEPCGLNQLYSLRYGTVPIVHRTGGLADTITDATAENLATDVANGFSFTVYDAGNLEQALTSRVPYVLT